MGIMEISLARRPFAVLAFSVLFAGTLPASEVNAQEPWRARVEAWLGTAPPEPTTEEQEEAVDDLVEAINDRDIITNLALGSIPDPAKYDPRNNLIIVYSGSFDQYLGRVALISALLSAVFCPGQFQNVIAAANDPCVRFHFFIGVFKHERFHQQDHNSGTAAGKSNSQKECDALRDEVPFYCHLLDDVPKYAGSCNPLRIVMSEIKIERKILQDHYCAPAAEGR